MIKRKSILQIIVIICLVLSVFITVQCENEPAGVIKDVPLSPEKIQPLLIGAYIPKVFLRSVEGEVVSLNKTILEKPSILIFYRGGWCPYCNLHLSQIRDIESQLINLGYQIIAISADRPEKLKPTIDKNKLNYTLLSDNKMDASKAFGIAFKLNDDLVKEYKEKYGIDVEADSGEQHHLLPVPSVFIVSKHGVIKFKYINPDYKVRINQKVLLAAAEAVLE